MPDKKESKEKEKAEAKKSTSDGYFFGSIRKIDKKKSNPLTYASGILAY